MNDASFGCNIAYSPDEMPYGEQADLLRRTGFDSCFFSWDEALPEHAKDVRAAGLGISSLHAPFTRVNRLWTGGEEGKAERDTLIRCLEDCARFEIPVAVMHAFIGFLDHTPTEEGIGNFGKIFAAGNRLGVKIALENTEGEEYLAALMKAFRDEPSLGFCLDTGHALCYNGGRDLLSLYGDKLCYTHVNDNLGAPPVDTPEHTYYNDLHLVPGDGYVDFPRLADRFAALSYGGALTCEMKPTKRTGKRESPYRDVPPADFYKLVFDRMEKFFRRK